MTEHNKQLQAMALAGQAGHGFDVLIVSTSSAKQRDFWQARLEASRGALIREDCSLHVVHERWEGGAGNGLGTLFALQEALATDPSLLDRVADGASLAVYHTAGKGTRLAPLPISEGNNKSSVKLPGIINGRLLTMLEAVIRQTSIYAAARAGRISVFWGDQIFIPSKAPVETSAHISILCKAQALPDARSWEQESYSSYGLIVETPVGCQQLEKLSYDAFRQLNAQRVALSLGCFHISLALAQALIAEFSLELKQRRIQLNSDPHFWMPLSLDRQSYCELLGQGAHYDRMQSLKKQLPDAEILHSEDIGVDAYWWDFGQLMHYYRNIRLLVADGEEADAMRSFFQVERDPKTRSCLVGSTIQQAKVRDSVLVEVEADTVNCEGAIMIACSGEELSGQDCLLYNVRDAERIELAQNDVLANIWLEASPVPMHTALTRNGSEDWKVCLPGNGLSYAEAYDRNQR